MLDSEAGSVESISTGSFGFGFERFIGFCVNASVSSDGRKHRVSITQKGKTSSMPSSNRARRADALGQESRVTREHDARRPTAEKAE